MTPFNPTTLSKPQIDRFQNQGYLVFENILSPQELKTARDALTSLTHASLDDPSFYLDEKGCLQNKQNNFFIQFEPSQKNLNLRNLSREDIELQVRKYMYFCKVNPFLNALAHEHPVIRGIVESILGANAILFQDMALVKPPLIGSEKPWHQDNAYFSLLPLDAVLGVWIALDDVDATNGCMHVLSGEHRFGPRRHHHASDCEIMPGRLDVSKAVPINLKAGGALFFAGMLPHQTPPNRSEHRRRALQFHYRSAESAFVSRKEYDRVYAEADGTPASCAAASNRLLKKSQRPRENAFEQIARRE